MSSFWIRIVTIYYAMHWYINPLNGCFFKILHILLEHILSILIIFFQVKLLLLWSLVFRMTWMSQFAIVRSNWSCFHQLHRRFCGKIFVYDLIISRLSNNGSHVTILCVVFSIKRIILHNKLVNWLPYSCDLQPVDYFFVGICKVAGLRQWTIDIGPLANQHSTSYYWYTSPAARCSGRKLDKIAFHSRQARYSKPYLNTNDINLFI